MSLVRAHLPQKLQDIKALKALSIKFMKQYIGLRLGLWTSTYGAVTEAIKGYLHTFTFGNWGSNQTHNDILDDCSTLKTKIEDATTFTHYVDIIDSLLLKVESAKKAEVLSKFVSPEALRGELYYAIIVLIHEMLKIAFPNEYQAQIETLRRNYRNAMTDYDYNQINSLPCEEIIETIHKVEFEMIKMGDRENYHLAFKWGHNPKASIFVRSPQAKGLAYLVPEKVDELTAIITNQMRVEQNNNEPLVGHAHPNANLPLFLQPDFAMYFSYTWLRQGLKFATETALKYYDDEKGKSFRTIIVLDQENFIAENRPDEVDTKGKKNKNAQPADNKVRFSTADEKDTTKTAEAGKEATAEAKSAGADAASASGHNSNNDTPKEPVVTSTPQAAAASVPDQPVPPATVVTDNETSTDEAIDRSASAEIPASPSRTETPSLESPAETPPASPEKADEPIASPSMPAPVEAAAPSVSAHSFFKPEEKATEPQLSNSARKKLARAAALANKSGNQQPSARK